MKSVWSYIKRKAPCTAANIEMVCRILFFCWKWIVVRFLTREYPHFKKSRIRRRWENMYHYKAELEMAELETKDMNNLLRLWALFPEPMPGMIFSRN